MSETTTMTDAPPALVDHDEAMARAEEEYERLLAVVDDLSDQDWSRPTDCTGWDVRAMVGHVLGMIEMLADHEETARQQGAAAVAAEREGCLRMDALTALQVAEHASLSTAELTRALHEAAPRALVARRATTAEIRATPFPTDIPGEHGWTLGYLLDVIHTRDPWLHRVDICRATGRDLVLTAEHDGRIVSDVVADWASRHGQPFSLLLTGDAGGHYAVGDGGPETEVDAVEFCRILSGRERGDGLLATAVIF
jgi:uncharacterized protein (TIGR03083 family)